MASDGKGSGPRGSLSPEERKGFADRAAELGRRLDQAKARGQPAEEAANRGRSYAVALRFASELVAGVGIGAFIGWALDRHFGTGPFLMVLFVILGFAAGMLNVIRAAQKAQREAEASQRSAPSVRDDDDET